MGRGTISPPASAMRGCHPPPFGGNEGRGAGAGQRVLRSRLPPARCLRHRGAARPAIWSPPAWHKVLRMGADEPQFLDFGDGPTRRRLAYRFADAETGRTPGSYLASRLPLRHGEHQGARSCGMGSATGGADAPLRLFGPRPVGRRSQRRLDRRLACGGVRSCSNASRPRRRARSSSARRWADGSRFFSPASSRKRGRSADLAGLVSGRARLGHDRASHME